MPKIINIGAPPTVDAVPVTNHPAAGGTSSDTYPADHAKPTTGGGGTK
jgi:hypothetical protein